MIFKGKVPYPKYKISDQVLVKGSQLEIERVLTVKQIQILIKETCGDIYLDIHYSFKESLWWHDEGEILKKVNL